MTFSVVLRRLREERKLSQKDIADYAGITRQAIAAYEIGKREPDYCILQKLADYFRVSVDFLLGRTVCPDENTLTVGKNIELIKGRRSLKEFSEDISLKTEVFILPELIELYMNGERLPNAAELKVFAKYACVRESFFFRSNDDESLKKEKELFSLEKEFVGLGRKINNNPFLENELEKWLNDSKNLQYVKFSKELQETGLPVEEIRPLVDTLKDANRINSKIL